MGMLAIEFAMYLAFSVPYAGVSRIDSTRYLPPPVSVVDVGPHRARASLPIQALVDSHAPCDALPPAPRAAF